jgi:hypothetical protein
MITHGAIVFPVVTHGIIDAFGNTKVFDFLQTAINHGHGISSHLGGTGFMPEGLDAITDEVFKFCTFQVAWHHLALGKGA